MEEGARVGDGFEETSVARWPAEGARTRRRRRWSRRTTTPSGPWARRASEAEAEAQRSPGLVVPLDPPWGAEERGPRKRKKVWGWVPSTFLGLHGDGSGAGLGFGSRRGSLPAPSSSPSAPPSHLAQSRGRRLHTRAGRGGGRHRVAVWTAPHLQPSRAPVSSPSFRSRVLSAAENEKLKGPPVAPPRPSPSFLRPRGSPDPGSPVLPVLTSWGLADPYPPRPRVPHPHILGSPSSSITPRMPPPPSDPGVWSGSLSPWDPGFPSFRQDARPRDPGPQSWRQARPPLHGAGRRAGCPSRACTTS